MFCDRRSQITKSPLILVEGSVESILLLRIYFFHSNLWICLLANKAITAEEIAVSKISMVEEVFAR